MIDAEEYRTDVIISVNELKHYCCTVFRTGRDSEHGIGQEQTEWFHGFMCCNIPTTATEN